MQEKGEQEEKEEEGRSCLGLFPPPNAHAGWSEELSAPSASHVSAGNPSTPASSCYCPKTWKTVQCLKQTIEPNVTH